MTHTAWQGGAVTGESGRVHRRTPRTRRARLRVAALIAAGMMGLFAAVPAHAAPPPFGTPRVSIRGFGDVAFEHFAAKNTFTAIFGKATGLFWGGGAQVVFRNGLYAELAVSRFRKDGQRAYVYNGQSYGLGIPLTVTVVPIDFSAGYRFYLSRRLIVYGGAGVGTTKYTETSQSLNASQNVSARATSYQAQGGAEFRLARWFGVAGQVQYRKIPGIIGKGGVSQVYGESNLGGLGVDIRFIVGR